MRPAVDANKMGSSPSETLLDKIWLFVAWLTGWRRLAVSAFVLGVLIALLYRPLSTIEVGDASIYDYIAQTILRGGLPYRDVVEIKAPGAIYLSALAMLAGRYIGSSDIAAVRMLNVLLIGMLSLMTFVVAWTYLRSRLASMIAVLIPLMIGAFTIMMNGGTQPKLPLMIFGLCSLSLTARNEPFWAGFFSMLSCLCWQPGLLFTGVVFLMFTRYLTKWRDLAWLKVLAGAAVPLAMTLFYFYSRGALHDLWSWTVTFNYSVFAPNGLKPIGRSLSHFWRVARRVYERDSILALMGVAGLVWYSTSRIRAKLRSSGRIASPSLYRDAIVIPPLVYLGFCIINFQAGPDLIPFLPFIGIFAAWFVLRITRVLLRGRKIGLLRYLPVRARYLTAERILLLIVVAISGLVALYRGASYRVPGVTLQQQYKEAGKVAALLGPSDKIYVHGSVELLVLLGRPNLNPYVAFDSGADDYIASGRPDGFDSIIEDMESQAPQVVSISRLGNVHHADDLMRWVNTHYDRWEQFTYGPVYIRRDRRGPLR